MIRAPSRPTFPSREERPWNRLSGGPDILLLALGAVLLRLVIFLGRGDYMAFDEGWYLLLGRSLLSGHGYSLIGIPHITLSPLFPLLAGAAGTLTGSWLWGGRLVAALASGALVLPAWSIFRRFAPHGTARWGALLVAVLPSMAPFGAPFFVGADLWAGAEPLLHLFLLSGVALWLRAREEKGLTPWFLSGAAFGLGFLARPEAILPWGILGLVSLGYALRGRGPRRVLAAAVMGVGLLFPAAPYWSYLHQVTGEWTLTGRGISPGENALNLVAGEGQGRSSSRIEGMLWTGDDAYIRFLYGLDPSGTRLRSDYWGVYPESTGSPEVTGSPEDPGTGNGPEKAGKAGDRSGPPDPVGTPERALAAQPEGTGRGDPSSPSPPSFASRLLRAMATIFPPLLWPFVFLGLVACRESRDRWSEVWVGVAFLGTSLAIALLVAVDPRTQLFLAPLLAFYAARGFALAGRLMEARIPTLEGRPGFAARLLVLVSALGSLGVTGSWVYLGLTYGSPHHVVATQNRMVGQELAGAPAGGEGAVASWHPSLALWADRDWRPLPHATLPEMIRYTQAAEGGVMVLSAYYPPFRGEEILGTRYLLVPVPQGGAGEGGWTLTRRQGDSIRAWGTLTPGS